MPHTSIITATLLSRYLRLDRCGRYLRFSLCPDEAGALRARYDVAPEALSPLLAEFGQDFEARVIQTLPPPVQDLTSEDWPVTVAILLAVAPGAAITLTQAEVDGKIGGWPCLGRVDILQARRDAAGVYHLRVTDVKASARDHVEYRLQVAFYVRLLRQMLAELGATVGQVVGTVFTRGEDPDKVDSTHDEAFDLQPYDDILDQLLAEADGDVNQALGPPLRELPYALNAVCDGCAFNQLCMVDSAERQDIAIVPTIPATAIQVLKQHGVRTLRDLAQLKQLPPGNQRGLAFAPGPGEEMRVAQLSQNPVVGAQLDRLVQRARVILRRFDPTTEALAYLLDSEYSQLPGNDDQPDLVKIFIDAQHDYLQDRLYLVSALVEGPNGSRGFAHCSAGPPTTASEGELLLTLLGEVIAAVPQVAADPDAFPFHLYLYDAFDQRVWLNALQRHLDTLSGFPAFYDLLTTNGGVDELMFSFLAHEIRERKNLDMTCQNLYRVATSRKFAWQDERYHFRTIFRDRVFDGAMQRADGVWIERRSQFNSHIPLEYAYGAWGKLPVGKDSRLTASYRDCTVEILEAFAICRLRAMAHLEAWLNPGHTRLRKTPYALGQLQAAQPLPALARSLEEFLGMEHHATLQRQLSLFQFPFPRRMQTGRCALLRCTAVGGSGKTMVATFDLDFTAAGLPNDLRMGLRIKEGDWMVLNGLDRQQPWEILKGRIAIVKRLEAGTVTLDLTGMTNYRSQFKYAHATDLTPDLGELYTLDEMVDDLNADKYLQAVRHAGQNALFAAINAPPTEAPSSPPVPIHAGMFAQALGRAAPDFRLTAPQQAIVLEQIAAPLLVVQGPPGTGKTATIGWAVLARIFCSEARPFRIFVTARTHKATNLILESIARCWRRLAHLPEGRAIGDIRVGKLQTADEDLPDGVQGIEAYRGRQVLADGQHLVLGGTPGGLYALMKSAGGKTIAWDAEIFDLLVIDEASQMSIPEALLAAAFMKSGGRILVVGDHRQMPPILAHPWAQERRRAALAFAPARSIFALLTDQGHPIVRLDESFRLHTVQAQFLADQIYIHDGLAFHSRRRQLLPTADYADPYVAAVLRPEYPIVVIEHDEAGSQQFNHTEIELIIPVVTACLEQLGLDGTDGLGIVVPHNAQKAALRRLFPTLDAAGAIDTVERFQGGERDVIIVSATASDPGYLVAEAEFLLNLNRLNVAFSRPRQKLIIVAARTLFRFLCGDLDLFEQALLWRRLRLNYATEPLWAGQRGAVRVEVTGQPAGHDHAARQLAPSAPAKVPALAPPFSDDPPTWLRERSVEEL